MLSFYAVVFGDEEQRAGRVCAADIAEGDCLDAVVRANAVDEDEGLQIL